MPFINLKLVGRQYNPNSYQYHQLAFGIESDKPGEYVHGLVTTLKTALIHPGVQRLPLAMAPALALFRNAHAALAVANVNFADHRRDCNSLTLEDDAMSGEPRLVIEYHSESGEGRKIRSAIRNVQKILRTLGCVAPKSMIYQRPIGGSVHYAGTLPMTAAPARHTTDAACKSRDFDNLFVVDGSTFPRLPAKNITFTLMANAARVADLEFS
jgi:choline dehydrogenase-like flavoprotein